MATTPIKTRSAPAGTIPAGLHMLPLAKVKVRKGFNPRQDMNQEGLADLADSMRRHGVLQPVVAVPNGDGVELLGGHRRRAAAELAGLKEIPVFVRVDLGDTTDLEAAVLDNAHRVDLNPLEEAQAYGRLRDQGFTAKGIAERLTVHQRRVTERLRILDTPKDVQEHYATGALSPQTAKALADMTEFDAKLAKLVVAAALQGGAGNLVDDPGWAAYNAVDRSNARGGLIPLNVGDAYWRKVSPKELGALPKDLKEKVDRLQKAAGQWSSYDIALDDAAVDSLRAAGVLYAPGSTGARGRRGEYAVCKDRSLLRTVCEPLIEASFKQLVKRESEQRRAAAKGPDAAKRADERAKAYQDGLAAREFNLQLGDALAKAFHSVDLSMEVALWLCLTALNGMDIGSLASRGLRYVLPQWQNEVHQKNGKVKVQYPSPRSGATKGDPWLCSPESLFWEWWRLAATPGEVVARTLIAFAAAQYARVDAVPNSQRIGSSPYTTYSYGAPPTATKGALEALEAIVAGKLPGQKSKAKPRGMVTVEVPGRGSVSTIVNDDGSAEVSVNSDASEVAATKLALALTDDQSKALLARTSPAYAFGGDSAPLKGIKDESGLTLKATTEACRSLVDQLGLLAPPQAAGYAVTDLGKRVAKAIRAADAKIEASLPAPATAAGGKAA